MNSHGKRGRIGGVLAAVAVAAALFALPGLASGHRDHGSSGPAGTVSSFDGETGMLTIDLAGGGSTSGLITRRTHIRCDDGRHRGHHGLRRHLRDSNSGRDGEGGRGEPEPGDDRGEGAEPGDDHGGANEPGDDRGEGAEPGDDNRGGGEAGAAKPAEEGDDHGGGGHCTAADLTPGATVKFADLVLVDGKAIFKLVALPRHQPEGEEEAPADE